MVEVDGQVLLNESYWDLIRGHVPPFQALLKNSDDDKGSFTSYVPICFAKRLRLISWIGPQLQGFIEIDRKLAKVLSKVDKYGGKVKIYQNQSGILSECDNEPIGVPFDPRIHCSASKEGQLGSIHLCTLLHQNKKKT